MTTANHPANQNPDGLGNLAQINTNHAKPKIYPAWVVVQNAGTDDESIVIDFFTRERAYDYIEQFSYDFEGLDIMKRLDDGTLTTEF